MPFCSLFKSPIVDPHRDKRDHILSAAERCFVRGGFHRSTMQDVAAEAGMSVGNVYRYFKSKDALVEGLVARDRAEVADDFEQLSPGDLMGSFTALMRRQIVGTGRAKAALWLEICTEAARNPAVGAVTRAYEIEIQGRLATFFEAVIQARTGDRGGSPNPQALAGLVIAFLSGLMVKRAVSPVPDDAEQRLAELLAIVAAALEGRLMPSGNPVRAASHVEETI